LPDTVKKRLGFLYAELGLHSRKSMIQQAVSSGLEQPVRLVRYFKGCGWGIKYLVVPHGENSPTHLVKAASRIIERRLRRSLGSGYLSYPERFRREAEIMESLAELGLGPRILLCESGFFVREFLPGTSFLELPPGEMAKWLREILASIDRMCNSGTFHTDPNAGNVIIDPVRGKIGFIDSEIPAGQTPPVEVSDELRAYCHERFLYSVGLHLQKNPPLPELTRNISSCVQDYYSSIKDHVLSVQRALDLLSGKQTHREIPL